jgi:uncharacterized membrane protein
VSDEPRRADGEPSADTPSSAAASPADRTGQAARPATIRGPVTNRRPAPSPPTRLPGRVVPSWATRRALQAAARIRPRHGSTWRRPTSLDVPLETRRAVLPTPTVDPEVFGRGSEKFARFMGTARFIVYMTAFVGIWLAWNTFAPPRWQFDPRSLNYTLLTLILSLQASYAAPLILLAQNRQTDRDRVAFAQDRQRAERNLADTEYLAREVAALRIALRDVATRDFVRSELRDLLEELVELRDGDPGDGRPGKPDSGGTDRGSRRGDEVDQNPVRDFSGGG